MVKAPSLPPTHRLTKLDKNLFKSVSYFDNLTGSINQMYIETGHGYDEIFVEFHL